MNQARLASTLRGLTNVAQKVYEHVPIQEHYTLAQINSECFKAGMHLMVNQLQGILAALTDAGLVRESASGFIRYPVKIKEPKEAKEPMDMKERPLLASVPEPKPAEIEPIDLLSQIATRLLRVTDEVSDIAEAIESAALKLSAQMEGTAAETQKLRQLQHLLKELA